MKKIKEGNHEHNNRIRRYVLGVFALLWCNIFLNCACGQVKFGVSDLEHTGDARALLALCYRAQKDNASSGGGNTRNCDEVMAEAIRHVRNDVCLIAMPENKKGCLCGIYKICAD